MIHEASTIAWGNENEIKKTLGALETIDTLLVDIYSEKTNIDKSEIENYISNETWFTADEAVELGFADEKKSEVKVDENMENILTNDFIENLFKNETFVQKVSSMVNNNVLDNKKDGETINNNGFFL